MRNLRNDLPRFRRAPCAARHHGSGHLQRGSPLTIAIENIDTARLREGIDDVDLRDRVAALTAEDRVRLSMSGDGKLFEKLPVRITSRKGDRFRGKLLSKPRQASLKSLDMGSVVLFTADQIHSIVQCKNASSESPSTNFRAAPETEDPDAPLAQRFVRAARPATQKKAGKSSSKSSRRRLRVEVDAARRFIQVPVGIARELHQYLRSRRIHSSPPQPYLSDFDCIELDRTADVEAVQSMLDLWQHP